jgi:ribosomal protein S18 acetylase RimI-like enzyme
MNPDGVSYDSDRALEMLYVAQADRWLAEGYDRHYVWLPLERGVEPWLEMGFSFMHQRGTRTLRDLVSRELPDGYLLRRGTIADLAIALELDDHLRLAQEEGPSYAFGLANTGQRDDWIETLEDPEVDYVIVEANGEPVAQCATFEVPERLGSFARSVHLSAVSVVEAHRQKGVARAMVDQLLIEARQAGYEYVETNWRVTNRRAARYWMNYGFTPTYVRLHRHVGVG